MIRTMIRIDEDLCNGCGLCVDACHEGALGIIDGKAHILRDDYCDGLGNCLPACPTGAISFEEREALPFDEAAVQAHLAQNCSSSEKTSCPGLKTQSLQAAPLTTDPADCATSTVTPAQSQLMQWPVQIKLVPVNAPYFEGAQLLIAADCTAYAYAGFHEDFMKGKITLIGCPKLDEGDYSEKLSAIFSNNDLASVVVARMEVPCCGGLENAVKRALQDCGKAIPLQVVTFSSDGRIVK